MKKICIASLFLIPFIFVSCGSKDDDPDPIFPDTVAPKISIVKPTNINGLSVIDILEISADITDDVLLDNVRVLLTDPNGVNSILWDFKITSYKEFRQYPLSVERLLPKYAATGDYIVTVEATDKAQNVSRESIPLNVSVTDVDKAAFIKSFSNALYRSSGIAQTLDWYGYAPWDYGYVFDSGWFNMAMYLIVTYTDSIYSISEEEWNKFALDFGIKNQPWSKLDENGDGNLNEVEFSKVMNDLKLFEDWNKNNDKYIDYDEMAAGFFSRWDLNKDNLLTGEEYLNKYYVYVHRGK